MPETEKEEIVEDVKLHRLTKPTTLARFAPQIKGLTEHVMSPEIIYEGLYMYFLSTVQQSEYLLPKGINPLKEFTIVTKNDIPVGFAHWLIKPPPLYVATAHMDFIYIWDEDSDEGLKAMIGRFVAFGRRHNCQFYQADYFWQPNMETMLEVFESKKLKCKEREITTFFSQELKKK